MTRSLSRQEVYPPRSHAILSRGRLSIHNMCAGPACLATSFVLNYLRMYHFLSLGNGLCCPRMAQKNRCAGIWNSRSPAARSLRLGGSLDPYLPKNTSNCGTYSEPDPCGRAIHNTHTWTTVGLLLILILIFLLLRFKTEP